MLGLKDRKREVYSFYIEVKRPTQESKYQPEDNFTKLLKTVKSSYDRQLVLGIKDPVALGLLCEGKYQLYHNSIVYPLTQNLFFVLRVCLLSFRDEFKGRWHLYAGYDQINDRFSKHTLSSVSP